MKVIVLNQPGRIEPTLTIQAETATEWVALNAFANAEKIYPVHQELIINWAQGGEDGDHSINLGWREKVTRNKHKNTKRVAQYTLNGDLLKIHGSLKDAAAHVNGSYQAISACLNQNRKSSCGFAWKFLD